MIQRHKQDGFTIIELLIATTVFSVVLLTISGAIIQMGRLYYKGITSARTQEVSRSIMDEVSQTIQFSSGQIIDIGPTGSPLTNYKNSLDNTSANSKAVCAATKHFSFRYGQQRTGTQHGLVVQDVPGGCNTTIAQNLNSGTAAGTELLGDKMRLSNLVVQQAGDVNTYRVTVRVIYGDNDLVCDPDATTGASNCNSTDLWNDPNAIAGTRKLSCKNIRSGTQFCAASELSTIVKRRLIQ
jgi:prepilin-type N-terminal cleavage/methylation domain-containing protein